MVNEKVTEEENDIKVIEEKLNNIENAEKDFYDHANKQLSGIDEKLTNIHRELGKMSENLMEVHRDLELGVFLTRASVLTDFKEVRHIQKEGYGRVAWKWTDILLYRLLGAKDYVIVSRGNKVGFTHTRGMTKEEMTVVNLCILPEYQGKGIGTRVLRDIKEKAKCGGYKRLTLHVREGNDQAKHVYKKQGFVVTGRKKRYYRDTKEDALVMTYELSKG